MTKADKKSKNELAVVPMTGKPLTIKAEGYQVKRRVTVPLTLMQTGDEITFRAEGEMTGGQKEEGRKGFDKSMTVLPIIDLETGEARTLIVQTVLESALKRVPGGYVGKAFHTICGPQMPGKRYKQFELFELSEGK